MHELAATLQVAALLLVGFSGYLWLRAMRARRHRLALLTTPDYTVGQLQEEADLPGLVEVGAAAAEDPSGPILAPYSRQPCVWFWIEVMHHHYEEERGDRLEVTRIFGLRSHTPFRLRDDSGELECVPHWVDVDAAEVSHDLFVPGDRPDDLLSPDHLKVARGEFRPSNAPVGPAGLTPGCAYRELIVRPGQDLFVRGIPKRDDDGAVRLEGTESQPLTVSTHSEQQMIHRDRTREFVGFTLLPVALVALAAAVLLLP